MPVLFRNFLVLLFFVVVEVEIAAQAVSPFSRFGLGAIRSSAFSSNRGLAEIGAGYSSNLFINTLNPASYSELTLTSYEVGANLDAVDIRTKDSTYKGFSGGLSHLALGFPLLRGKLGLSFGLLPYSHLNYNFTIRNIDTFQVFRGSGSLSQFYIGSGFKYKGFSVGVNAGYIFGRLDYFRGFTFTDTLNALSVRNSSQLGASGFNYNVGLQYKARLKKRTNENHLPSDINLTVGAYGSGGVKLNSSLNGNWQRYLYSKSADQEIVIDTVLTYNNQKGKITMPYLFGLGLTVGNENWWIAGVDFRYTGWSKYQSDLRNGTLGNSWRMAVAAGIVPNQEVRNFLAQIQYKGGFYFGKSEVIYNARQLDEYGGTLGFTLPVRISPIFREAARIHLVADIGTRTPGDKALLTENYYRIYVGFTLGNMWFQKRRFD